MGSKSLKRIRWTARILSLAILAFGLPFYFGYGNPLPFLNPAYSLLDNAWLCIFPLMFLGLILGWKYERLGGWLVCAPIAVGMVLGLAMDGELVVHMLVPLAVGVLYLVVGYKRSA
ncbi:MAG: hypothetical protein KQH53_00360 [Desulfarculaceae bacterium]|nr:hypothetical protein [Desulfarculaceae bacterium]